MSSGKSETEQTTTNAPPAWAAPLFQQSAKDALNLYNSGAGFKPYQGDQVADLSAETLAGVNALSNIGGTTGQQLADLYAKSQAPTAAETYLKSTADGSMLEGSPFFNELLDRQAGKVADSTSNMFAAGGRYGSGAAAGAVADSVGDFRLKGLESNYQSERDRQIAAANSIQAAQSGQIAQGAGLTQSQLDNQLAGAQGKLAAGSILDTQNQAELDANIATWLQNENIDWTRLGALQSAAQGAAGAYGTSTGKKESSSFAFDPFKLLFGIPSA